MKNVKFYKFLICIPLIIGHQISYGQVTNDSLLKDSIKHISGVPYHWDLPPTKWITIGTQYDFLNTTIGLSISNGFDERPLIHFEDFPENFIFKIKGSSDFHKDYNIGLDLEMKYLTRLFPIIAVGFNQFDYPQSNLFHRDIHVSAERYFGKSGVALRLKIASQVLNNYENAGADIGIQKILLSQKIYTGISIGYYFDYFTYAAYLQGFVYKNKIGMRLNYQKIDNYDFLNLGLNFTFNR